MPIPTPLSSQLNFPPDINNANFPSHLFKSFSSPSDLMKSTVVMNVCLQIQPEFCSERIYLFLLKIQQNDKSTPKNLQFLQCLTANVKFWSLLQVKMRFVLLTQMCLMILNAFQVPHTISELIQVLQPSKPLANQSMFICKSLSNGKLKRCYKQKYWSQLIRQPLGLTVLFLFRVKISWKFQVDNQFGSYQFEHSDCAWAIPF